MLQKSKISKIKILSDEWYEGRLGKFTSSEIHFLLSDRVGRENYIRRKAGELITGKSVKGEIDTEGTRWGAMQEADAVRKFAKYKELEYIVCQQLITSPDSHFGSTPDGLIVLKENSTGDSYQVETLEVKCPPTYQSYVGLALCKTPQDLKRENYIYYWQVLDQMDNCDCMVGWFAAYHPDFVKGNMNIIEFRKMQPTGIEHSKAGDIEIQYPLVKDINYLKQRKQEGVSDLENLISELYGLPTY